MRPRRKFREVLLKHLLALMKLSGSIERVNGASGEASSASQLVLDNAGSVSEKTHQLQEQVDQFIEHIKICLEYGGK